MQYYRCKCGKCEAWNTGETIQDCHGCKECNTTFSQSTSGHKELQPHDFSKVRYNESTGKPYKLCSKCHDIDDVSYKLAKIKDDEYS